jgi:hypothetical protein
MSSSFWNQLATYCQELAPVAGPLLGAVGDTASAVERAGRQTRSLQASSRTLAADLLATEDDF